MPMTFLEAAQEVARNVGGQANPTQQAVAKAAIVDAIRTLDSRHNWEFTLITLPDFPIVTGTDTYPLVLPGFKVKRVHSARLKINKRTLVFVRQRQVDRVIRDQEQQQIPLAYTEVLTPVGISMKLFPIPSVGDTAQVRVYRTIKDAYSDNDPLDVPDRYLPAVLAWGRYHFLIDRNALDPRADNFLSIAEQRYQDARTDDVGQPDEDVHFVPTDEWAFAAGPDPINDLMDLDF